MNAGQSKSKSILCCHPEFVDSFLNVGGEEKLDIIEELLSISPHQQRYAIERKLLKILKRDFIKYLPSEVTVRILKYLDVVSLCNARSVCRSWKSLVDGCKSLWKRECANLGIVGSAHSDNNTEQQEDWHSLYFALAPQVKALKLAYGFERISLREKSVLSSYSLYYKDNLVMYFGRHGEITAFDIKKFQQTAISAQGQLLEASLFDSNTVMVTKNGYVSFVHLSFDSLRSSSSDQPEVKCMLTFSKHAVCYNANRAVGIVAVGFRDCSIELHALPAELSAAGFAPTRKGLLNTYIGHVNHIQKVEIVPVKDDAGTDPGNYRLISWDLHYVFVWALDFTSDIPAPLQRISCNAKWEERKWCPHGVVYRHYTLYILYTNTDYSCWLKKVDIVNHTETLVRRMSDESGYVTFNIDNCGVATAPVKICSLVDIGARFLVLVCNQDVGKFIVLLDHENMRGGVKLFDCNAFAATFPAAPGIVAGDANWLDGFSAANLDGVLFAYIEEREIYADFLVHLVLWNKTFEWRKPNKSQTIIEIMHDRC